ncbi:hypothetical protein [Nostoc sp.]|uniref:hypothetical protein n=1 Tax=Nostoc sp. TaxID=1180 RepID=UPI002FFBE83F
MLTTFIKALYKYKIIHNIRIRKAIALCQESAIAFLNNLNFVIRMKRYLHHQIFREDV